MSVAAVEPRPAPRRFLALSVEALRGIGWLQVRVTMLAGLAIFLIHTAIFSFAHVIFSQSMSIGTLLLGLLGDAIADQLRTFGLLPAVVIANRAVDEGAGPRSAYVAAAVGGCVLGLVLSYPFGMAWDEWTSGTAARPADQPWYHGAAGQVYWPLLVLTQTLLINGSAVFVYAGRRAARLTQARLQAAELDRIRRSRLALESRLQAMQARIEPQFLFNTLAQVERLYEDDPALAARMLDDLIAYLRAAMPLMRDTSSTVGREIALARAYLDIVRLRLGDRLGVDIEVPPDAHDIRMPPMMLLPLIDHAVVRGLEPAAATGTIRIRGAVHDGRLRVTICDSGVGFAPETDGAGIAALRERLDALYGGNARLDLRRADQRATEAVLELPLEPRGSADAPPHSPSDGEAS